MDESKLLEQLENAFLMECQTKECSFRRTLSVANVEYFLRNNNISGLDGDRSETWAFNYKERIGEEND